MKLFQIEKKLLDHGYIAVEKKHLQVVHCGVDDGNGEMKLGSTSAVWWEKDHIIVSWYDGNLEVIERFDSEKSWRDFMQEKFPTK